MNIQQLELVKSTMSQDEVVVLVEFNEVLLRCGDGALKLIKLSKYTNSLEISFPESYVGLEDNFHSSSKSRCYEQSAGRFKYYRRGSESARRHFKQMLEEATSED